MRYPQIAVLLASILIALAGCGDADGPPSSQDAFGVDATTDGSGPLDSGNADVVPDGTTTVDVVGADTTTEDTVTANQAPTVTVVSPAADAVFNVGESISFEVEIADAEDTSLAVKVESSAVSTAIAGEDVPVGTYKLATDKLPAGKQTLTFTVTDGQGASASASVSIWVNTAPDAPKVAITPEKPLTTDDLVASVSGLTDVDRAADQLKASYSWTRDGQPTGLTGATVAASETAKGETWVVSVLVNDGYADSVAGAATVIIGNSAPAGLEVTIAPEAVDLASAATCALVKEAQDADGDPVNYTYQWSVNGAVDTAAEATASIVVVGALHRADGSPAQVGDTITCTVTPTDGSATGAAATSPERKVGAFSVCGSDYDDCGANAQCSETQTLVPACACKAGFSGDGKTCADDDECKDGSAACDVNAACANTAGSYDCTCNGGYAGDGKTCADVDECKDGLGKAAGPSMAVGLPGWGVTNSSAPVGWYGTGTELVYNDPNTGDYAGTGKNKGIATSPEFAIPAAGVVTLSVPVTLDIEPPGGEWDTFEISVLAAGVSVATYDKAAMLKQLGGAKGTLTLDVTGLAGKTVQLAFAFDTIDAIENATSGIRVGQVVLSATACSAQATCSNKVGSYGCACNAGFAGDGVICADIDECKDGTAVCDVNAACSNTTGAYDCTCKPFWKGDGKTCTDVDECASNNGGCGLPEAVSCTNNVGAEPTCSDIDECKAGTDKCDANATCANTDGSYDCTCNAGYAGDGKACTDVDECKTGKTVDLPMPVTLGAWLPENSSPTTGWHVDGELILYKDIGGTTYEAGGKKNSGTLTSAAFVVPTGSAKLAFEAVVDVEAGNWDIFELRVLVDGATQLLATKAVLKTSKTAKSYALALDAYEGKSIQLQWFFDTKDESLNSTGGLAIGGLKLQVQQSICGANSTCENTVGSYTCGCITGFTLQGGVCVDVDECETENGGCDANATCKNNIGAAPTCTCKTGFAGDGKTCSCLAGFTLQDGICIDNDECETGLGSTKVPVAAKLEGWLVNNNSTKAGWYEAGGELVYNDPQTGNYDTGAANNGTALSPKILLPDVKTAISLSMPVTLDIEPNVGESAGYDLFYVAVIANGQQLPVASKASVPTGKKGGVLEIDLSAFAGQEVQIGFSFDTVDAEVNGTSGIRIGTATVQIEACGANAACTNVPGAYTCACEEGFFGDGKTCKDVAECAAGNGGCDANATCKENEGAPPTCTCKTGFTGDGKTCTDVDECKTENGGCDANATCKNNVGAAPTCTCKEGFTGDGKTCTDVDECKTENGGCDANATCENNVGAPATCTCKTGFTGDGKTCTDVDECKVANGGCDANATCKNNVGAPATCTCKEGFTGDGKTCKQTLSSSCVGNCGDQAPGGCFCDDLCTGFGDCCSDYAQVCK